ncbi:MAG TPA: polysaccharide pyruvyl transferase family protein [Thermoanaerobaculia bacterium]|jgi:polysaccharide pyruvyl transferase CsaB|nr:polysaccharide pyruvyl transferase family protein [Thermoanaerobaculia bacterium]
MAGKRVLVIGYYGDGNTGDEAVLTTMMRGLREGRPDLRFIVPAYSADPAGLRASHGVESFPFRDIGRMLDAVDAADLVILGGGGLLHDYVDPRPETMFTAGHFGLSYYCGIPWLAARLGKPVLLYAVGVGPLLYPAGRELTRDVALAAGGITVRDAASAEILRELAGADLEVEVTADPVWRLIPAAGERLERLLAETGIAGGRWLGVAVRNWNVGVDQARWEEELLAGIAPFAAERGLGVLFLPFQHAQTGLQNDLDLALSLRGRLHGVPTAVLDRPCPPEELAGALGACELLVGMRLHSILFACMTGTPFVALDYDPKVPLHARLLDPAPPVLPIGSLAAPELRAALERVWSGREDWAGRGRELAAAMRARAGRNDELAGALLDAAPRPLPRRLRHHLLGVLREREELRLAAAAGVPAEERPALRAGGWPPALGASGTLQPVSREVRILAPAFFDPQGERVFRGGAERYLVELARVVERLGLPVAVFQPAAEPWVRETDGLRVHGLAVDLAVEGYAGLDRAVLAATGSRPLLTIHLAFYTAGPDTPRPALGISHGVYWDDPASQTPSQFRWHRAQALESLQHLDLAVSVDTNTINWVAATSARLAERMVYVPNFVDLEEFRPAPREGVPLTLLFPRRLVAARGFWLVAEILPGLLADHPRIEIHFVGEAAGEEEEEVRRLVALDPRRVHWRSLPPERMPEAYAAADVVLIPTLHSEGTSLSALEAQAAGRTVIATRVGGLSDLVLDGYNGLLIEPDAGALRGAVERLILDPELRERLARQGLATVQGFGIERWRTRWEDLLRTFLPLERGAMDATRPPDEPALRARLFEIEGTLARLRADAAEREIGGRLLLYERDAQLAAREESRREAESLAREREERLREASAAGEALAAEKRQLAERLQALDRERLALSEQRDLILAERGDLDRRLTAVERTLAYRLVSRFWRLMRGVFPEGSRRRKVYRLGRRAVGRLLGAGPEVAWQEGAGGAPAGTSSETTAPDPRADLLHFEARVRAGGAGRVVAIFSGTQLLESEGQRPTQLALALARSGVPVVFVYWRWWDNEWRPQDRLEEGIVQIPIDVVTRRPETLTAAFEGLERIALFEFPHPGFFETLAGAASAGWITVYDVLDDWEEFHRVGQAIWYDEEFERHLIGACDAVFAINEPLARRVRELGGEGVELAGNGLKTGIEEVREPRPLVRGEITVGYFGYLAGAWFDWELIAEAARRRPAWRFYLIGYGGSPGGMALPANVELLGKQPQADLAAFAANWDVALIPFKPDRLAAGADPIKTYEYLAMGLPVVVTGVYPPTGGEAFVARAEGVEELLREIELAAPRQEPGEIAARRAFAATCTWDHRLEALLGALAEGRQRVAEKRALLGLSGEAAP